MTEVPDRPLNPEDMPLFRRAAVQTCPRCEGGYTDLVEFAGQLLCDPCVRICHCRECKAQLSLRGHDLCADCLVAFYIANPAEFVEFVRLTTRPDADDRELVRRVLEQRPKMRALVNYDPKRLDGEAA